MNPLKQKLSASLPTLSPHKRRISVYGIFASLLWIITYASSINTYYGSAGLDASLRRITDFVASPIDITVGQYILLICILRIVFCAVAALLILWISSRCRNSTA